MVKWSDGRMKNRQTIGPFDHTAILHRSHILHFEPLRPNRFAGVPDRYEFAHGTNTVCVYDIRTLDFVTDSLVATHSARQGFEDLGITGYIQGISIGRNDEVYVYGCSGNGAIVRFEDVTGAGRWTISYPGGKTRAPAEKDSE